jgi:GDP-D-mannose dehydratase
VDETGFVAGVPSSSEDLPGLSRLREGDKLVFVDPRYFRPTEVETLLGSHQGKDKARLDPRNQILRVGAGDG